MTVALPARDEAATIGAIVTAVRPLVVGGAVEEILVCDDHSTDATASEARAAGATVVVPGSVDGTALTGKGEALWTLACHARGEVVVYLDADLTSFDPGWVTQLAEPVQSDPGVALVKGRFARPLGDDPAGGGRVTELMAKPALALLLPHLAGIAQPLGGELAVRRSVLSQVPFLIGWGVDVALLADITALAGIDAVREVDLGVRRHRNKPLAALSPMAEGVLHAVLDRAGIGVAPLPERPPPASSGRARITGDDEARVVGG